MGPQLISCGTGPRGRSAGGIRARFNGAAADQLRNAVTGNANYPRHYQASMGPQLISCGTSDARIVTRTLPICFNGAAADQLRNVGYRWVLSCGEWRWLQWGRS